MNYRSAQKSGFTLVEVIFVAALSALIFGALFGSFTYTLKLINLSRAKLSAQSVGNDRMEYFRSLPYNDVGTVSGIPSGAIPQNSTTTLNGIVFSERVLVEYVDDPADGLNIADTNGIPSDYKRLKLEYTWEMAGATSSIFLLSSIVPRSIETTAGGGTVRVNVIDDNSALLPGATVRLVNSSSTAPIDVTKTTDSNGAALFSGAPADSNYEVFVTAVISGDTYSSAQTYVATTSNPNPSVAPFAVLEADISTLTFQIGELSDLEILTRSVISEDSLLEDFDDLLSVDSYTNVAISADDLVLDYVAGAYLPSGEAYLGPITPVPLLGWSTVRVASILPFNTSHKVQFYTGVSGGPYVLIPDSDMPGNSVGFTDTIIDVAMIDPSTYPTIFVGASLFTADTAISPTIDEIEVFYQQSETVLSNVAFDIRGNKTIGTDLSALPIYKYNESSTTDASGYTVLPDLEFDTYTVTPPAGYDIASACPEHPFVHQAGIDGSLRLELVANAAETLRVSVVNSLGQSVPGASVNVTRSGYDVTLVTNTCGQVFFTGGISPDTDYVIDISVPGYSNVNVDPFEINGDTVTSITLF
ncbi:MAG: carboxypeptidase-like regulatory domain-containing protein [Candidatus Pacebacteria bacterium]|nr:carboxypeptidase-like regulatory domain-containing protein [Candidatus Paceibacterota bacterium]